MSTSLLSFSKYSGCGNDFIVVDNREECWILNKAPEVDRTEIARMCHRRSGIGADGVIFVENAPSGAYRMRIFNADGTEAEMCGNGVRCLAGFLRDSGIRETSFAVQTMQHIVQATINQSIGSRHLVEVTMPAPTDIAYHACLPIDDTAYEVHSLNTGVPHAVLFVNNLECPSLMKLAPKIRSHKYFPQGTNVNFVSLTEEGKALNIRTYERGVEQETLACGTGAVAAAITASQIYALPCPVAVHTRSTEILHIDTSSLDKLTMTGPAVAIYKGFIEKSNCSESGGKCSR